MEPRIADNLSRCEAELVSSFRRNSIEIVNKHKYHGQIRIQSFQPRQSKDIIDKVDDELAAHYQLADEETDFIINYDIKYRMGGAEDDT